MPSLFDPVHAGSLRLPNRIVMAPLTRNRAPDAVPTPLMAQYYAQRANAGLLITEATAISAQGQGYADVPGLYGTEQLDGWKRVTQGGARAQGPDRGPAVARRPRLAQRPAARRREAGGAVGHHRQDQDLPDQGWRGRIRSHLASRARWTLSELPGIVHDYRHAARHAVTTAGFDGVEVHGANGYLLDQFLKTGANQRRDDYGGPIENRARLLLEVMRAIAGEIGGGRTGVRLSPVTPANDIDDEDPQALFEYVVRQLAPLDLAYIHVIEGATGGAREIDDRPFDYAAMRDAYRMAGGKGAWMVNNGYDKALAEQALAQGADLVAFGKAFIANPDLVDRMHRDAPLNVPDKSTFYRRRGARLYRLPGAGLTAGRAQGPTPMGAGAVITMRVNRRS